SFGVRTDWARAIPRELARRPASERAVLLACWERWCRRQAGILLEESSPLTGKIHYAEARADHRCPPVRRRIAGCGRSLRVSLVSRRAARIYGTRSDQNSVYVGEWSCRSGSRVDFLTGSVLWKKAAVAIGN